MKWVSLLLGVFCAGAQVAGGKVPNAIRGRWLVSATKDSGLADPPNRWGIKQGEALSVEEKRVARGPRLCQVSNVINIEHPRFQQDLSDCRALRSAPRRVGCAALEDLWRSMSACGWREAIGPVRETILDCESGTGEGVPAAFTTDDDPRRAITGLDGTTICLSRAR